MKWVNDERDSIKSYSLKTNYLPALVFGESILLKALYW